MTRPKVRWLFLILLLAGAALSGAACGDDPQRDDDSDCTIGSPLQDDRNCECTGNSCVCPSSGDCAI